MEKSWVLPRNLRNPQYPPAPVRAPAEPRAPGKRSPPCSPARQDARKGTRSPRGCPGSVRRPPRPCQGAAQKFTARPGPNAAHRPGLREPQSHRAPPLPRPQARKAHRGPGGPPCAQRQPATRQVQLCRPEASGGRRLGPGGAPDGIASQARALTWAAHSTGVAGCPAARCWRRRRRAGRVCGPAPSHVPTSPPLPGEPTGRAASAPVRTRRAAFHRGRRRRRAGGGARRCPQAVPRPGCRRARSRSCAPSSQRGRTTGLSLGRVRAPPRGGLFKDRSPAPISGNWGCP